MFAQQIRLLLAYCRALNTTELTVWQRYAFSQSPIGRYLVASSGGA
jgi:hypothetical protein